MPAFSRLRRRFSNKPNVIQTRQGTERLPFKSFHPHWIVGRGLCMYRSEDFGNVPRNKRRAALDLKLPLWSPFADTVHHCVWEGGRAMVWFWDADAVPAVSAAGTPDGTPPDATPNAASSKTPPRIRPETVFLPRMSDGVHMQACREGFELQHWRDRVLEHAFWFGQRPDQARIESVLAQWGADIEALQPITPDPPTATPEQDSGAVAAQDLTHEPWSSSPTPQEWLELNERPLATGVLLVLVLTATWHEARYWQARHLQQTASEEFAALQQDLDPILSARNDLLTLRGRNLALAEILREPSQAFLMGLVDGVIPGPDARFRQWSYQQRELSVVVEDESADPIVYVRALEAHPMFDQVAAEQGRKENEIRMTLTVRP